MANRVGVVGGARPVKHEVSPSSRRIRLDIAYDGAAFFGAQVQPGRRTVGGDLVAAFARLTGAAPTITFAGRTDRGVHAAGQVAHCDIVSPLSDRQLHKALNALLSRDVVATGLRTVDAAFHARYDARWREYRYRIWNGPVRHPAQERESWHLIRPLDPLSLDAATRTVLGEHDFAAFAGQRLGVPGRVKERGTVRTVSVASWQTDMPALPDPVGGILLDFWVRANGFLPQMVRTIVGAAVVVGTGQRSPEWFETVLRGCDRSAAPAPAPPQGLSLWRVGYEEGDQPSAVSGILADTRTIRLTDDTLVVDG